jgi:hypothetical protein
MRWMRVVLVAGVVPGYAAVIGMNTPVKPLTEERVRVVVPSAHQGPWLQYLKRSSEQMAADKTVLAQEREGMTEIPALPSRATLAAR